MELLKQPGRYQWQIIIFCFLLAALTGVLYRLGMVTPLPADLSLQNVRHAHSHLMFFGWAAALPLFIMLRQFDSDARETDVFSIMSWSVWGVILFGLLSYPFFLLYGYHPVTIGGSSLPLSVVMSGLVMVCWYLFIAGYLLIRSRVSEIRRNSWFEAALLMLFISSLGAWGVAVVQALNVANPLIGKALTHFFLACFTEGWVVLATIALLDDILGMNSDQYLASPATLTAMLLLGAPLTFPYGISETLFTPFIEYTARAGGLISGTALFVIAYSMLKSGKGKNSILIWPISLLLLKPVLQIIASVSPSDFLLSDHALRIFYLHVLLLGAFTLSGIGYLHTVRGLKKRSYTGVAISILLVLISLLLLTRLWPASWGGIWIYYAVTATAVLPVLTVAAEWKQLLVN